MMGAKVVGRTKKSARLEDDEDEFDDKEEEESDDDDDQSTAAVVNVVFRRLRPAKVFDKKPSKTDEKKKATAKGYRRLKKFRWRKFLTARYWRRDQRFVKLLFVVYAFVAAYSAVQKKRCENQTVLLEEEGGKVTRERRQRGGDADEICVNCELID